ncbi:hypothetical protein ACIG3E_40770 [Streptomyces sp. NPDC053474]
MHRRPHAHRAGLTTLLGLDDGRAHALATAAERDLHVPVRAS